MVNRVVNIDTTHRPGMNQAKEVEKSALHCGPHKPRELAFSVFSSSYCYVGMFRIITYSLLKYNENLSCTSSKQG